MRLVYLLIYQSGFLLSIAGMSYDAYYRWQYYSIKMHAFVVLFLLFATAAALANAWVIAMYFKTKRHYGP